MSFVWSLITTFLYLEVAVLLLLILPIISAHGWDRILKSRLLLALRRRSHVYFLFFMGFLVLFMLDAIRQMHKFSITDPNFDVDVNLEMQNTMHLYCAERNFYISGFAIFLALVISRVATLIIAHASLMKQYEAATKEGHISTISGQTDKSKEKQEESEEPSGKKDVPMIEEVQKCLEKLTADINFDQKENKLLQMQVETLAKDCNPLTDEYGKLKNIIGHEDHNGENESSGKTEHKI